MTVRFRPDGAAALLAMPASSGLVRRLLLRSFVRRLLLRSHGHPARQRLLTWLLAVDDARLLRFGLTPEDVAILRATTRA
jgi:hypothetical protein